MRIDGDTGALTLFTVGLDDPGRGWAGAIVADDDTPPPECTTPTYVWGRTFRP